MCCKYYIVKHEIAVQSSVTAVSSRIISIRKPFITIIRIIATMKFRSSLLFTAAAAAVTPLLTSAAPTPTHDDVAPRSFQSGDATCYCECLFFSSVDRRWPPQTWQNGNVTCMGRNMLTRTTQTSSSTTLARLVVSIHPVTAIHNTHVLANCCSPMPKL